MKFSELWLELNMVSVLVDNLMTHVEIMELSVCLLVDNWFIGFTRAGKQDRRSLEECICNSGSSGKEARVGA